MGMDGLSMANTGVVKESTSADFANRTEQIMQADPSNDSKQVQTLSTNRRVREKDDIIELYDSTTDRLIETISGSELRELVKKLNMASGIFVNKKV